MVNKFQQLPDRVQGLLCFMAGMVMLLYALGIIQTGITLIIILFATGLIAVGVTKLGLYQKVMSILSKVKPHRKK